MGAKSERSCVFHLVGMQTMRTSVSTRSPITRWRRRIPELREYLRPIGMCFGGDHPDNCIPEMERVIATARAESRPAYILVASDYAVTPVTPCNVQPYPILRAARILPARLRRSPSASRRRVLLRSCPLHGVSLQAGASLRAMIEKLVVRSPRWRWTREFSRIAPQFAGMYSGAMSSPEVLKAVEGADLVIDAERCVSTPTIPAPTAARSRPANS